MTKMWSIGKATADAIKRYESEVRTSSTYPILVERFRRQLHNLPVECAALADIPDKDLIQAVLAARHVDWLNPEG